MSWTRFPWTTHVKMVNSPFKKDCFFVKCQVATLSYLLDRGGGRERLVKVLRGHVGTEGDALPHVGCRLFLAHALHSTAHINWGLHPWEQEAVKLNF